MQLKNDTFLRALRKQKTEYTPVWLMRQAGRYLPEYMATRQKAGSFMGLATNPSFATEVTLQPVDRYPLDAAILFSDILTVPDAMGLGLSFVAGEGPRFAKAIQSEDDVKLLHVPDPYSELGYVMDAVRQIKKALDGRIPLIGFSGSPFTLASYMIEGGSTKDFRKIKGMLFNRPDLLHQILTVNCEAVTDYLNAQIEAGVQAVMIFDTWGGVLAHSDYLEFSLGYMKTIVKNLHTGNGQERIPVILFTKGSGAWLMELGQSGADAIGVDWTVSLKQARLAMNDEVALQGNLDPMVLFSCPENIRQQARRVIDDFGRIGNGGHVFNLGHGVDKNVDPEAVSVLVDEVHEYSKKYHK